MVTPAILLLLAISALPARAQTAQLSQPQQLLPDHLWRLLTADSHYGSDCEPDDVCREETNGCGGEPRSQQHTLLQLLLSQCRLRYIASVAPRDYAFTSTLDHGIYMISERSDSPYHFNSQAITDTTDAWSIIYNVIVKVSAEWCQHLPGLHCAFTTPPQSPLLDCRFRVNWSYVQRSNATYDYFTYKNGWYWPKKPWRWCDGDGTLTLNARAAWFVHLTSVPKWVDLTKYTSFIRSNLPKMYSLEKAVRRAMGHFLGVSQPNARRETMLLHDFTISDLVRLNNNEWKHAARITSILHNWRYSYWPHLRSLARHNASRVELLAELGVDLRVMADNIKQLL